MIITENEPNKWSLTGNVKLPSLILMDIKLLNDESTEMMEFMDEFLHIYTQCKLIFQAPQQH